MQLLKFLKIFFGLPALVRCGIACCVTHLYVQFIAQLQLRKCSSLTSYLKAFIFIFCIININHANAQTASDTTAVDTTSMLKTDSINSPGYDDEDDGYVDTTVQHIYDTSQYFFNQKEHENDLYSQQKIAQRHLIDDEVNALKKQKDFWYIPAIEKLETHLKTDPKFRDSLLHQKNHELTDEEDNSLLLRPWFNTLIWIIIIGIFAAAVIYFLTQNNISIFSKEAASAVKDEDDEVHENIFHLSYTKLILQAEKEKDYRVAIRLLFLQTLKLLSDANAIQYQPEYTNLNYLQQLHQSKYYNEFFSVMHSYEYVWYGKFFITQDVYATIKNNFLKLQNKIVKCSCPSPLARGWR